ncbi:hypothetical protein [Deinococcus sp. Leaf326]|uniref:hypothetical protein n=1 Tax=Deinococcus sp. Leaf326 TaxID=1736338 RepID=UPI000700F356|nr:hypothetical protein [Deinococcus sp. Leaf326]KQR25606.1 hypothetical protein ASF71_18910 [Deinococcus sp. Leaf326]
MNDTKRRPYPLTLLLAATAAVSLAAPPAQADGIGDLLGPLQGILGALGQGNLLSMVSMIPGLNFLAGLGPIMDVVNMIPGLSGLLNSIPGVGPLLGLLGMGGGGANLGPLTSQVQDVLKWVKTAKGLYDATSNMFTSGNYSDMASGVNSLMQMAKTNHYVTGAQMKSDPQAAANQAINALTEQQRSILKGIGSAQTDAEATALRNLGTTLEASKAQVQRSADNADVISRNNGLTKETQDRVTDSISFSGQTAQAISEAKKIEDITKLASAAQLQSLKVQALNSAALTAGLANMTKVQVAQSETLGQILSELQSERISKAQAIMAMISEMRVAGEAQKQQAAQYAGQVGTSITGPFRGGQGILGEP